MVPDGDHLDRPQARLFLDSARGDNDPLYAGYVLILAAGLRRGELLGLARDDIDLESVKAQIAWHLQKPRGLCRTSAPGLWRNAR